MIGKAIYLVGFCTVVYLGMNYLGQDRMAIIDQASQYMSSRQTVNVRLGVSIDKSTKLVATPSTLGIKSEFNTDYEATYTIHNPTTQPVEVQTRLQATWPSEIKWAVKILPSEKTVTILPDGDATVKFTYLLEGEHLRDLDTVKLDFIFHDIKTHVLNTKSESDEQAI